MATTLRDLNATIDTYKISDGQSYQSIFMDCPLPDCGHSILIPFSDEGKNTSTGEAVWTRTSGSTIDDITLSPSYRLMSNCCLHGWVRNGTWVSC
jgi:hypothetical protein